ncbi:metal ABC transporter solute-binding protein, Zn/Mn family [Arthrobacter bambusae]|uniref:metal ABC transporter solute-binding protein, Zn/Mn family n=1 Tax=Arthrobacter bambusae TaxID=1338426 RepID=UPI0027873F8E|nr:zinc ABC transporter substrate-binding protein [Arthrobacter bambusae]MDQ0030095.1 zinc/manganese transport system substrate-binding protein [Arthrobacter bambusae]MDQ0097778.1 zinc/manganese transport system substrate-binding protein [Arthrobacter bambusae]
MPSACAAVAVLLAACAAPGASAPSSSSSGVIDVVASTSVYGDIAKTVGGGKVSVTSIISKTSQDPHSYEASTQDKLAVSKAQLVIDNGAGYDDFFAKLADDGKIAADKTITAVNVSGLLPAASTGSSPAAVPEGFNEHVWYNFDAMAKVADAVAAKLGSLDPADANTFTANAGKFKSSLTGLSAKVAGIKASKGSAPVAITEPVPGYLLEAAGLENKTPEEFSRAIEVGSDVPPAAVKETSDLITSKSVRFLAYNEQTASAETEKLKAEATAAGVPVIGFTETLPEGKDYVGWMTDNVGNVAAALKK